MNQNPTSTGLQENVASLLCYVLGWVSGIVFLILEPNNKTIKFHAIQSIIVFAVLSVVYAIFFWIPVIGWILWVLIFITWVILMIKALQGGKWKFPVAGDLAEKLAK
jgi:uncharacterized membrane protein